jgi:hypothetical protein
MPSLLSEGNTKTGRRIAIFNLPRVGTCPGATELCISKCYAKAFKRFPSATDAHAKRFELSKDPHFAERVIEEIQGEKHRVVRIHSVGDFYSAGYTRAWIKIAKACPETVFFAYTRSWRVARVLRALQDLRRLPNVQLWWSQDKETGQPPEGLVAYMAIADDDIPPDLPDLFFRTSRKTLQLNVLGVAVCPKENGHSGNKKLTCATCRLCFSNALHATGQPAPPQLLRTPH